MTSPAPSSDASPFSPAPGGARVAVRLTPKGGRTAIDGVVRDAEGKVYLKVRVSAPPEDGKANAALIKTLAKAFGVPPGRLSLIAGAKARRKIVHIAGATPIGLARLKQEFGRSHD